VVIAFGVEVFIYLKDFGFGMIIIIVGTLESIMLFSITGEFKKGDKGEDGKFFE
jgi:hypothetical protein